MSDTHPSAPRPRRKPVLIDAADLVTMESLVPDGSLPLVIRPSKRVDLVTWTEANRELLERRLHTHGAILFRDFGVREVAEFERFALALTPDLLNYVEGSSPRTMLAEKVYTSTEYPPEYPISLHNELSYAHKWPAKLFFFCQTAPRSGGETPIADCRRVLRMLPQDLVSRFTRSGVRYLRNLRDADGPGLAWSTVFETRDKDFVERYCAEGGIDFQWHADGSLQTSQVRPAVIRHPVTGEPVWFNQADQWHPSNLGEELSAALNSVADAAELPINAAFGDGSPIDVRDLGLVRRTIRTAMVRFAWKEGDILLIDNMLVAHGRMPFTGPRRVLVTMGETVYLDDVTA
ncbi:TauD/TfdA family dioxygenase [Nonomuraea sp. NPDC049400]|uniref:TauD/TfdA family dioxygenase n=1 Tax=Nonomuraea sp. NPDC049400 TaxID=3364352 RepID=UPI0037A2C330